jgi:invasion protein IalB
MRYGTHLVIDDQPPLTAAFFTCIQNGCMSDDRASILVPRLRRLPALAASACPILGLGVSSSRAWRLKFDLA